MENIIISLKNTRGWRSQTTFSCVCVGSRGGGREEKALPTQKKKSVSGRVGGWLTSLLGMTNRFKVRYWAADLPRG